MKAMKIDAVPVDEGPIRVKGKLCFAACVGVERYDDFKKCPDLVQFQGVTYRKTGWNSDTGRVHYQETERLATSKERHDASS